MISSIPTPRLILRTWRASDLGPFARMNGDPRVMEFFPRMLAPAESQDMYTRIVAAFEKQGFGLWAVEIPGVTEFAGFIGLSVPTFEAAFMPCVEIGWRMATEYWGKGYASEGAHAAINVGFEQLGLKEIISFTSPLNVRSIAVMQRLGMTHDPNDDFDHPRVPERHVLRRHVLYRIHS